MMWGGLFLYMQEEKPPLRIRTLILIIFLIFLVALIVIALIFAARLSNLQEPSGPNNNPNLLTVTPEEDVDAILANPLAGIQETTTQEALWPYATIYWRDKAIGSTAGNDVECAALDWASLNPEEGKYDFSSIDQMLDAAKAEQKYVIFRVLNVGEPGQTPLVPAWAKAKGVTTSNGLDPVSRQTGEEIDYHKCQFLDIWEDLVMELIKRYDSNPQVIGIDIGSYGWNGSWVSGKTVESNSTERDPTDPTDVISADTRTRISRMFTGGKGNAQCVDGTEVKSQEYDYPGFANKFTFISTINTADVAVAAIENKAGIRFENLNSPESLGRSRDLFGEYADQVWVQKPVVAELTKDFAIGSTSGVQLQCFIQSMHITSIKHNYAASPEGDIEAIWRLLGPRIILRSASYPRTITVGQTAQFNFDWINKGSAVTYSNYPLTLFFKRTGSDTIDATVSLSATDSRRILPADMRSVSDDLRSCEVDTPVPLQTEENFTVPAGLTNGSYDIYFGFMDEHYNQPLQLALKQKDESGRYFLGSVTVAGGSGAVVSEPVVSEPVDNPPLEQSYCGDGIIQKPNSSNVLEICDDGNTQNGDACSNDCRNLCPGGIWDGSKCVSSTPAVSYNCVSNQCVMVTDGSGIYSSEAGCLAVCNPIQAAVCGDFTCNDNENGNTCSADCATSCNDNLDNNNNGLSDEQEAVCHTDGNAGNSASYDPALNNEPTVVASSSSSAGVSTTGTTNLPKTALGDDLRVIFAIFVCFLAAFVAYRYQIGKAWVEKTWDEINTQPEPIMPVQHPERKINRKRKASSR